MPVVSLRGIPRDLVAAAIGGTLVAVLTTGAAVAVSTTAVSITNPTTGKRAHVTNQSSLVTSDRDPHTGTYARVDAFGRELVSNVPGKPWNTLSGTHISESDTFDGLVRAVGPEKVALTSLTLTPTGAAGRTWANVTAYVSPNAKADCEGGDYSGTFTGVEQFRVVVNSETVHLTWPSPLIWSVRSTPGAVLCVVVTGYGPTGWSLAVAASGFRI